MPLFSAVGGSSSVGPTSGGKVYAVQLSTVAGQIVAGNPSRVTIIFHNPAAVSTGPLAFVAPILDGFGNPLNISLSSLAGAFTIVPGGFLTITGECQQAWQGLCYTGSIGFTVMESNLA